MLASFVPLAIMVALCLFGAGIDFWGRWVAARSRQGNVYRGTPVAVRPISSHQRN